MKNLVNYGEDRILDVSWAVRTASMTSWEISVSKTAIAIGGQAVNSTLKKVITQSSYRVWKMFSQHQNLGSSLWPLRYLTGETREDAEPNLSQEYGCVLVEGVVNNEGVPVGGAGVRCQMQVTRWRIAMKST